MATAWRPGSVALALTALLALPCAAQDFYQGKSLTLLAGAPAGSDQDKLARLVAKYLAIHIPGKPSISVENRSANAGFDALNSFANEAPKDGTALHLVMPGMTLLQTLGAPGVRYDSGALGYVGNLARAPHVLATWWVTGFKTIDDGRRREMLLGAVGPASPGAIYPAILNGVLRTRFKTLAHYRRDAEVDEAMENTEIGGRIVSWASLKANKPDWIAQKRVNLLAQIGLTKHADLPDVPLLSELAAGDRDRALLAYASREAERLGTLAVPGGVPGERLEALRAAFDAMAKDSGFSGEARAAQTEVAPTRGVDIGKLIAEELAAPKELVERLRAAVGPL